jgi:hypothetical protein
MIAALSSLLLIISSIDIIDSGKMMKVFVKTLTGRNFSIDFTDDEALDHDQYCDLLKQTIEEQAGIPKDSQRIIFAPTRVVEKDSSLSPLEQQSVFSIYLVLRQVSG